MADTLPTMTDADLVVTLRSPHYDSWVCRLAATRIEMLICWREDLQSGMFINCVYCGHRYGPRRNTPVSMANVLKKHIEQCPQHPMSALKVERDRLQGELDHQIENHEARCPYKQELKRLVQEGVSRHRTEQEKGTQ